MTESDLDCSATLRKTPDRPVSAATKARSLFQVIFQSVLAQQAPVGCGGSEVCKLHASWLTAAKAAAAAPAGSMPCYAWPQKESFRCFGNTSWKSYSVFLGTCPTSQHTKMIIISYPPACSTHVGFDCCGAVELVDDEHRHGIYNRAGTKEVHCPKSFQSQVTD